MEKYILNNTPIRTANNFGINDITVEMEKPIVKNFENVTIIGEELNLIELNNNDSNINNENIKSRIGLEIRQNYCVDITVPKGTCIEKPIEIDFDFDEDNLVLIDNIKITLEENSKADFNFKYISNNDERNFHYLKQEIFAEKNSSSNISITNMMNNESDSFIAVENTLGENAKIKHILVEIGGKNKISNYYSKLAGYKAENEIKNIYLGTHNNIIDINYNIEALAKNTKCIIESQGAISDNARKNFKGVIDFKKDSAKSIGIENENCMILSDNAKSKSLPVLLCHEEDVEGKHGVSSGKIDPRKLFYIMTKGISLQEAKRLLVKANFSNILKELDDENLHNEILSKIDQYI